MIIKLKRGLAASWVQKNPILDPGEPGIEIDTGLMKIGNGINHWNDLLYSIGSSIPLDAHIASLLPHPVYDDGPSLVLLYENAKV